MSNHYATALNSTPSYWGQFGKKLLHAILLATLLGGLITAMILYFMPKKYESRAVVCVHPSLQFGKLYGGNSLTTDEYGELFLCRQIETIHSQKTYAMVSVRLDLPIRWSISEEEVIAKLHSIVALQRIRESDIISINVTHANAQDARDIAQEIYECYREQRDQEEKSLAESALKELQKAIQDQAAVLEAKRARREELMKKAPPLVRAEISKSVHDASSSTDHYKESVIMFEKMKAKLDTERTNLSQPYNTVDLYEAPVIANSPTSSRMFTSLLCGIVGLPSVVFLLGFPMTGIMHFASRREWLTKYANRCDSLVQ